MSHKLLRFVIALLQISSMSVSLKLYAQNHTGQGLGAEPYFCGDFLESLPIQQSGRVKPLYVHASEMIKYLTGKSKLGTYSATKAYCLLSLQSLGLKTSPNPLAVIEHVKLRETLGLAKDQHSIPYTDLIDEVPGLRTQYQQIAEDNSHKKSLGSLISKIQLYKEITSGQNWLLPDPSLKSISWIPLISFLKEDKIKSAAKISPTPFEYVLKKAQSTYIEIKGDSYLLELKYAKARLPMWAFLITLLAAACIIGFRKIHIGLTLTLTTVFIQGIYITLRVLISGRAPITNMYETVLFSGFGSLVLSLIIASYRKEKTFILVGLLYNLCTLMMLNFAGGMLSSSIGPLVPVLRDNFWLSTHVTTIILSYGALALSWVLANMVLIKKRLQKLTPQDERYYSDLIYTCLKYGTTMLAAGIILGGVWADYSWGRFWGWDPKETWSLIAFLIYMSILHGRHTSWIPPKRFVPLVAAAFMSVMMAWFGVNYILATGLHSYGFSEGGAIFLGSFFLVQITIIVLSSFSSRKV